MTTDNKFAAVMSKKTDAELLRILTIDTDKYQPEALATAEAEFQKRDLTIEQTKEAEKITKKAIALETAKADEPLDSDIKWLVFLIPTKAFISSGLYAAEGYDRKAKEIMQWCYYGFGFYISIIAFIMLLNNIFS